MAKKPSSKRKKQLPISPGLREIRTTEGMSSRLADHLKISRQAISDWQAIPISRLNEVEEFTGIPRERLRPELYRRRVKRR